MIEERDDVYRDARVLPRRRHTKPTDIACRPGVVGRCEPRGLISPIHRPDRFGRDRRDHRPPVRRRFIPHCEQFLLDCVHTVNRDEGSVACPGGYAGLGFKSRVTTSPASHPTNNSR